MSRYTIDSKLPGHYVTVGYDRPLRHFFGEVRDEEGDMIAQTDFMNGVPSLTALEAFIAPYAEIESHLGSLLAREAVSDFADTSWGYARNLRTQKTS
jgi:hypothetical protein